MLWFSEGLVSVRSEVGFGDLGGLFQPRRFCDSVDKQKHFVIFFGSNVTFLKERKILLKSS